MNTVLKEYCCECLHCQSQCVYLVWTQHDREQVFFDCTNPTQPSKVLLAPAALETMVRARVVVCAVAFVVIYVMVCAGGCIVVCGVVYVVVYARACALLYVVLYAGVYGMVQALLRPLQGRFTCEGSLMFRLFKRCHITNVIRSWLTVHMGELRHVAWERMLTLQISCFLNC